MKVIIALITSMFVLSSYAQVGKKTDDLAAKDCLQKAENWCSKTNHRCKTPPKNYCKQHNNVLPAE